MRINDTSGINKNRGVKKKRNVADSGGDFEVMLEDSGATKSAQAAAPTSGVLLSNINMLTAAEISPLEAKEHNLKRSDDLLEEMETLKLSLLSGGISPSQVQRMTQTIRNEKREALNDPALNEIMDAIELRCEVELAKLERSIKY